MDPPTMTARRPSGVSKREIHSRRPESIPNRPTDTSRMPVCDPVVFSSSRLEPVSPPRRLSLSPRTSSPGFSAIARAASPADVASTFRPSAPTTPSTRPNWTAMTSGVLRSRWTSKKPSESVPANHPPPSSRVILGRKLARVYVPGGSGSELRVSSRGKPSSDAVAEARGVPVASGDPADDGDGDGAGEVPQPSTSTARSAMAVPGLRTRTPYGDRAQWSSGVPSDAYARAIPSSLENSARTVS
jgi:hypothetical protein